MRLVGRRRSPADPQACVAVGHKQTNMCTPVCACTCTVSFLVVVSSVSASERRKGVLRYARIVDQRNGVGGGSKSGRREIDAVKHK